MGMSFFVTFAIALAAAIIGYQSREEMVKTFSIIIMAVSLLLSFAWAPWFVQILILVASLGGIRYFCYRHSCHNAAKLR